MAAAAWVVTPLSPAAAATCTSADGVSVVVDFHGLGGGVQSACLLDGGGRVAADLFPAAGFGLDYVQRQPGFVCRVSGKPADAPCVNTPPADAYWALWWSDGRSGTWTYSTFGAGGLKVPDGGYVAFSWNGSSGRVQPGLTPSPHPTPTQSTPSKSPKPTKPTTGTQPTQTASSTATAAPTESGSPDADESAAASPSADESAKAKGKRGKRSPSADTSASSEGSATASESIDADADAGAVPTSAEAVEPADDGLPAWVAPVVIAALFAAGGAAAVVRRRRSGP